MLRRESELRRSEETQLLYAVAEQSHDSDWLEVTARLQKQVLAEFGVSMHDQHMLGLLRRITHPDAFPMLSEEALYVKFNRARDTDLKEGDSIADAPLVSPDCSNTTTVLAQAAVVARSSESVNKVLVLVSGSYS